MVSFYTYVCLLLVCMSAVTSNGLSSEVNLRGEVRQAMLAQEKEAAAAFFQVTNKLKEIAAKLPTSDSATKTVSNAEKLDNIASKLEKEFAKKTAGKIATDALSKATLKLGGLLTAIKSGDEVSIWSNAIGTASAVLIAIPGAEAFGAILGLISVVTGVFSSPKKTTKAALTIDEIRTVVDDVVSEELDDQVRWQAYLNIQHKCSKNSGKIQSQVWAVAQYWLQPSISKAMDEGTISYAKTTYLKNAGDAIDKLTNAWLDLKTAVTKGEMVSSDASKRQCVNVCYLLVAPYDAWLKDQGSPDLSVLRRPEFESCPANEDPCPTKTGADSHEKYKLCLWHKTKKKEGWSSDYLASTSFYYQSFVEIDKGCKARVDRATKAASGCLALYREAQRNLQYVVASLKCLASNTLTIQYTIERSIYLMQHDAAFVLKLGQLKAEMGQALWYAMTWTADKAIYVDWEGNKDMKCGWESVNQITSKAGYENTVLHKCPCSTQQYCNSASETAYCGNTFICDNVNPGQEEAPWDFIGPAYDYNNVFAQEFTEPSSIF